VETPSNVRHITVSISAEHGPTLALSGGKRESSRETPAARKMQKRAYALTLGLGPPSGVSIGRLSGVGALWDCVPRVCDGGGGCAGGGVPLGAVPVLSWCGEVSLGGIQS